MLKDLLWLFALVTLNSCIAYRCDWKTTQPDAQVLLFGFGYLASLVVLALQSNPHWSFFIVLAALRIAVVPIGWWLEVILWLNVFLSSIYLHW